MTAAQGRYCEPGGPCEIDCVDGCQDRPATTERRRWRRWIPLLLIATFTLGMSLSISEGHALGAALQGLLVGLYFWDVIDSLPRRHRGS